MIVVSRGSIKLNERTYEDEFVILAYTAEAICPTITADIVECDGGDEGRVALTSGNYSLFPRRIYIDEVVLAARL